LGFDLWIYLNNVTDCGFWQVRLLLAPAKRFFCFFMEHYQDDIEKQKPLRLILVGFPIPAIFAADERRDLFGIKLGPAFGEVRMPAMFDFAL
jgi:hypothetical protein